MAKKQQTPLEVETLRHDEATRRNIPTAEHQSVMEKDEESPIRVVYNRRNRDLDPQLVWRGKDEQDWSDLVVQAPPLYIQEKVHPKVLIDDLLRRSKADAKAAETQIDLFADFNGLPDENARTEFYQHDGHWANRMILGDSLQVMASLAEREGLRGKVQCIYLDPPYGIKFNSNFQWSTTSRDGQLKEAEISGMAPSSRPTRGDIRHGFVYERVPHITLKSIANNAEIDVIWDKFQFLLEPLREKLNSSLHKSWQEWEIPRDIASIIGNEGGSQKAVCAVAPGEIRTTHQQWWDLRIERQQQIDASIAAKAESEYLYDKPYPDKKRVRVAGPFTVESISPHRVLGVGENDELIDTLAESSGNYGEERSFVQMILENLRNSGVQQAHKEGKITFTSLSPWPGELVCAEGRYLAESEGLEKRAAIFIGPEFGTVSRPDLVAAAREAGDSGFDVLVTCAFNYDAHSAEFNKLGRIPVLKARMNADLHMADDLKNTGKGNLFVIFGEPDIDILTTEKGQLQVQVNGVDVFHPNTGEVRSDGDDGIACWFIDTDYNMESFFVRHAYFLGASDPYKVLKTTLKAEINEEAWATLNSNISRPFDKPETGRIAVKVINHLGDEVMKVFKVL